jgi:glycosyltransferase 2 family protein
MSRPTLLERLGEAGASATSLRGGMPRWQRAAAAAMVALVVAFLVAAVVSQWSKLPDIEWRFRPAWLAVCVVTLVLFQLAHAHLWVMMLRALGAPVPPPRGWAVWSITLLARYVPTNLALAASRMALAEREGVPKRVCAASIVYELGFTFAGAAAVGAYFVVTLPDLRDEPARWLALAAPVLCLVALDPRVFHTLADGLLRRLGRAVLPTSLSRTRVLEFSALFAASFLLAGFAVYAFAEGVHGVAADDAGTAVGSYAVGFAASVIAFVLPGGLGAREGAMVAALSPILPFTVALAVAVGVRLVQMAVEVLYAALTPLLARRAGVPVE